MGSLWTSLDVIALAAEYSNQYRQERMGVYRGVERSGYLWIEVTGGPRPCTATRDWPLLGNELKKFLGTALTQVRLTDSMLSELTSK